MGRPPPMACLQQRSGGQLVWARREAGPASVPAFHRPRLSPTLFTEVRVVGGDHLAGDGHMISTGSLPLPRRCPSGSACAARGLRLEAAVAQTVFEPGAFALGADQPVVGEIVARKDRGGQFQVELMVVGHDDEVAAGGYVIHFSTTSSLTTFSTPRGISAGNSFHANRSSAPCTAGWPAAAPARARHARHRTRRYAPAAGPWARTAAQWRHRSTGRGWRRGEALEAGVTAALSSISRAICWALYSRWPPPMVSYRRSRLTTIFEPALRGVEPRSMMVTSTQGSPCCCRSASASIQAVLLMVLSFVSPGGACKASPPGRSCCAKGGQAKRCPPCVRRGGLRCRRLARRLLQPAHLFHAPEHALGVAGASICGCAR